MTHKKVYVDTTVLTDALLKRNHQGISARNAIKAYPETILPVYAIKEFKAGPLNYFIWLHNKLLATKSLAMTLSAIEVIVGFQPNRARTSLQALSQLIASGVPRKMSDEELADLYRFSIARLITSAWRRRRHLTSSVSDELKCYSETDPKIEVKSGRFANPDQLCKLYGSDECCMARSLKSRAGDLDRLIAAIKDRAGREHTNRRGVLHKLSNTPKRAMDARDCVKLGDAYFALQAPSDAPILTTNLKDHFPLAAALGKLAIAPET